jgi:amino acid permease
LFAIIGGIGSVIGGLKTYLEALILVFSIMLGSLMWWAILSRIIETLRDRITENRLKVINQIAGVVMLIFGGVLFFQLAVGAMSRAADAPEPPRFLPGFIEKRLGLLGDPV